MSRAVLIAVVAVLCVASAHAIQWVDCGKGKADASVSDITFTPDPAKGGQTLTVTFGLKDSEGWGLGVSMTPEQTSRSRAATLRSTCFSWV